MTDEERDLSYIIINKNSYKNIFIPSENKIIEYFNNNKKLFTRPENRSFKQFNFKSKDEAEKFKIKISGLSKEEIINYSNKNNIIFNNFENLNKNQVLDELSEVIFSLKINNVSKVVKTTLAYHVIFLENITLEKESSLEDVKDSIENTLTNIELENFFRDLKLKINQQILEGYSIIQLAQENNLIIETMKKEKYLNEENNDLNREIIDTAFNLKKDFISDIKDFNNEISFFVNVDEIYPSKSEKIENILDEVINDFIISKKISFSKKIFDENKNNNDLNKIIDIFNSKKEIIDLKKNDEILTASLRKIAFETELNNLAYHNDEDNIYFIKIKKINIPSDLNETSNIEIKSDLKNAFGNEIIKTKKITLNEELINGLLSQYK